MKKPADYTFIKRMLKLVETHNVRVMHEVLYAGILLPGNHNVDQLKDVQKFLPDELHIIVKCKNVFETANVLADYFDNVIAGVLRFSTIQDGVKVVFNFVQEDKQGSVYHFDDQLVIDHEGIPWLGLPDYLRTIAYNHPSSVLYDTRAEMVAQYLQGCPDKIESLVPTNISNDFRQNLIDAIAKASVRIECKNNQ